ncbi:uncharacterized protein LOC115111941 [Oncorhynchus nerka]|uniref:uncharacterized protein LOC115111941 n=1 Tax=Oncorhynchus nerka TaxID=8023 RepID=UPI0031B89EB1
MKLSRTAASDKMVNGLGRTFSERTFSYLRFPFSLNLDESTSNSNKKVLSVLVSYYHDDMGKVVVEYLGSLEVIKVNAVSLDSVLCDFFNHNILVASREVARPASRQGSFQPCSTLMESPVITSTMQQRSLQSPSTTTLSSASMISTLIISGLHIKGLCPIAGCLHMMSAFRHTECCTMDSRATKTRSCNRTHWNTFIKNTTRARRHKPLHEHLNRKGITQQGKDRKKSDQEGVA